MNTINNVPRELLERLSSYIPNGDGYNSQYANDLADAVVALEGLSGPSPAGVDGLEVVGYSYGNGILINDTTQPDNPMYTKLVRLSDAQAIIDGLRGENERIRLNIAEYNESISCYQSDRDQQAQRIGELEGLLRDSAELIKHGVFEDGYCCCGSSVDSHGLGDGHSPVDALAYHAGQVCERIDAALSAGKEGE